MHAQQKKTFSSLKGMCQLCWRLCSAKADTWVKKGECWMDFSEENSPALWQYGNDWEFETKMVSLLPYPLWLMLSSMHVCVHTDVHGHTQRHTNPRNDMTMPGIAMWTGQLWDKGDWGRYTDQKNCLFSSVGVRIHGVLLLAFRRESRKNEFFSEVWKCF